MPINPTTLKALIDTQITDETVDFAITPTEVGERMKDIVDYATEVGTTYKFWRAKISFSAVVSVFNDGIAFTSPTVSSPTTGKIVLTKTGFFTGIDTSKLDFISEVAINSGQLFVTHFSQGGTLGESPNDKCTLIVQDLNGSLSSAPSEITVEIRIYP